ncbi:MAG: hypothetical protein F4230_01700, partial [Holophagales bacterium]|nr:hypothetical protein [Holophagales bacterium]
MDGRLPAGRGAARLRAEEQRHPVRRRRHGGVDRHFHSYRDGGRRRTTGDGPLALYRHLPDGVGRLHHPRQRRHDVGDDDRRQHEHGRDRLRSDDRVRGLQRQRRRPAVDQHRRTGDLDGLRGRDRHDDACHPRDAGGRVRPCQQPEHGERDRRPDDPRRRGLQHAARGGAPRHLRRRSTALSPHFGIGRRRRSGPAVGRPRSASRAAAAGLSIRLEPAGAQLAGRFGPHDRSVRVESPG